MTDSFEARLSEYVDGTLSASEAREVERHLAECPRCSRLARELRAVAARARKLGDRRPPEDLWPGIERRIAGGPARPRVRGREFLGLGGRLRERRFVVSLPQLAAAAILLVALSAGGAALVADWARGGEGPVASGPGAASAPDVTPGPGAKSAPEALLTAGGAADADGYARAIADLEAALFFGEGVLDSLTVRKLRASLETIDRAIRDARRALEADASDPYLYQHLAEARRHKVRFLRQAAALVAAQS